MRISEIRGRVSRKNACETWRSCCLKFPDDKSVLWGYVVQARERAILIVTVGGGGPAGLGH